MTDAMSAINEDMRHVETLEEILVSAFNEEWKNARHVWENRSLSTGYHRSPLPDWIGEAIEQKDRERLLGPLEEHELERIEFLARKS